MVAHTTGYSCHVSQVVAVQDGFFYGSPLNPMSLTCGLIISLYLNLSFSILLSLSSPYKHLFLPILIPSLLLSLS